MTQHAVKNGLDIPISGGAAGAPVEIPMPTTVAYCPREFKGILPRLKEREGATVKRGTPVFFDKSHPEIVFLSPVSGTVKEIRRGRRRVITDYVIEVTGDEAEALTRYDAGQLASISRDDAKQAVLQSGYWPALRTRPLNNVATPDVVPQAILISATETGPVQPGADALIAGDDKEALQAAVNVLKALTDGKVYLATPAGSSHPALQGLSGAETHSFSGPHPSGDPSVQVNLIQPPKGTGQVWYLRAWDAVALGHTLLNGEFYSKRVYAANGDGCKQPRLVSTILGAPLSDIVGDAADGPMRWIRGSVLTGTTSRAERWAGFYPRSVHVLPDTVDRQLFGWANPFNMGWSFHRAFLKGFTKPQTPTSFQPGIFGGIRAIVPVGVYGKVVATPDILPEFLFKSIVAGDLEESIQLGLLDMTEEEAALCTYICPSKVEFDVLLRQGLDLYEKEA